MSERWAPSGLTLKYGREMVATASDLEESDWPDCSLRLALKMRRDTYPDTGSWRKARQAQIPLGWFLDALPHLHRSIAHGNHPDVALAAARATYARAHPGLRVYLDHALEEYLDLHQARERVLGSLTYLGHHSDMSLNASKGSSLSVWAPMYETSDGHREVRRLRMRAAKDEVTAWAAVAAKVAAERDGRAAVSVSVLEVSLADGSDVVLLDRITPAEADSFYERLARPRALTLMNGETATPCSNCADCKAVAVCTSLAPMNRTLRQTDKGIHTRSVSASDLVLYERCPARWYLERECRLPLADSDGVGAEGRSRGTAIHRWLKTAHSRGIPCSNSDLPAPSEWGANDVAHDVLDVEQYRSALPFLRQHQSHCVVDDGDLLAVDEAMYGWDPAADLVIAATPDLVRQSGDTVIFREVKSTEKALPEDADAARDQFDGVVYWWLSMLNGGWIHRYDCAQGAVELEILRPDSSAVFSYSTSDADLVEIAEDRMDSRVSNWHKDSIWSTKPGPGCADCPVSRWCPDRDVYLAASIGDSGEPPF